MQIQNAFGVPNAIDSSLNGSKKITFNFLSACYLLALATQGFGSLRLGFVYTDLSTYFVYIAFFIQLATGTVRFPKILLLIYSYIVIHSFVFNFNHISFTTAYLFHFIGFILYSLTIFSYVSVFRNKILAIMHKYYKFVFVIACIAIVQTVVFIAFGISIQPQTFLYSANEVRPFEIEILGILPRALGLSSEPAHFAILLLPGVYIVLLVLTSNSYSLNIKNKKNAAIILIAFILSFSIVGFFGLFLCLISIFGNDLKKGFLAKVSLTAFFIGLSYLIYTSPLMIKLKALPAMISNIESFEFTVNDLSGFALVSNLYIAQNALSESSFLGTGFNTHRDSYDKFIYKLFNSSQEIIMEGLNREGAGSLFIRIISEFGLPGIGFFLFFLYHYWIKKNGQSTGLRQINNLSIITVISYSMRNGQYLSLFLFLFLALTYYTHLMWTEENVVK